MNQKGSLLDIYRLSASKLKLNHVIRHKTSSIDLYLCIPSNPSRISKATENENYWAQHSITTKRRYIGDNLTLSAFIHLLDSALLDHRKDLSLLKPTDTNRLWHQYKLALSNEIKQMKVSEHFTCCETLKSQFTQLHELFDQSKALSDPHIEDLEDLMNWTSIQALQRFLLFIEAAHEPRLEALTNELQIIIDHLYQRRETLHLNTPRNSEELAQFLEVIHHKKKALHVTHSLDETLSSIHYRYQVSVLGLSAAIAMLILYALLVNFGNTSGEVTIPLLIAIAFGYGMREIFKESIKKNLGKFYKAHFYAWKRSIKEGGKKKPIANQWIALRWLNSQKKTRVHSFLPAVNLSDYEILHFKSLSTLNPKRLPDGYYGFEESIILDLSPFAKAFFREKNPILLPKQDKAGLRKIGALFKCYLLVKLDTEKEAQLIEFHINKEKITNLRISSIISSNKK